LVQQMYEIGIAHLKIRQNCKMEGYDKLLFFESLPQALISGTITIKCKRPKENNLEQKVELKNIELILLDENLKPLSKKNLEIPDMENDRYNGYLFLSELKGIGMEIDLGNSI